MTADLRPPSAIRLTRPYATEEDYLKSELETLTRTGITLIGAQNRPEGVVLRFELVLSTGQVMVRGEGRVVAYKPNAFRGAPGLVLRFTRLDVRSKALIDKAAAMRETRRESKLPPPAVGASPQGPTSLSPAIVPSPSLSAPIAPMVSVDPEIPVVSVPPPLPARRSTRPPPGGLAPPPPSRAMPPLPLPVSAFAPPPPSAHESPPSPPDHESPPPPLAYESPPPPPAHDSGTRPHLAAVEPRPDRDALLARLRTRAKGMDPAAVTALLEQGRRALAN